MNFRKACKVSAISLCLALSMGGCGAKGTEADTSGKSDGASQDGTVEASGTVAVPFSEYFEAGEVENNGSYFVRVGDKVYYRLYSDEAQWESRMWGEGYLENDDPEADSVLMSYDLQTKTTETLFTVNGRGRIFASVDGFCISGTSGGQDKVFCYSMEDGEKTEVCAGKLMAVSEDGKRLVALDYVDTGNGRYPHYSMIENGQEIYSLDYTDGGGYQFLGLAGDDMIAWRQDDEGYRNHLISVDSTGKVTELGIIPQPDYDYETYGSWPELLQLLKDDDGVYLSFGYYEGTGHFLAAQQVVKAKPGAAGSLEAQWLESTDAEEGYEEKIFLTGNGEWEAAWQVEGEIGLSDDWCGDLVYFDSPYGGIRLAADFIDEDYTDEQGRHKELLAESAIQDTAFIILGTSVRNEAEDIGWREMYDLVSLQFMALPIQENGMKEAVDLGYVAAIPDGNAAAGSAMDMLGVDSPEELYQDVLDELLAYLQSGDDGIAGISTGMQELRKYNGAEEALNLMGYCFVDVNRDGIPELLVGEVETGDSIVAGYTVEDREVYSFLEGWSRNRWQLLADGSFLNSGSSGAMYSSYGIYSLPENSATLQCEDYYFSAPQDRNPEKIAYYHNDSGISDVSISEATAMTADSFWAFEDEFISQARTLDFIPFSKYGEAGEWAGAGYTAESLVTPRWAEELIRDVSDYEDISDSSVPTERKAMYLSSEVVYDFKLLALSYKDFDNATGKVMYNISEVYSQDELRPELPLVAPISLAGTIPNNGFSYKDSSGVTYRFAINASGRDGSLVVEPID